MALPEFSIVVPVYNEGDNIARLLYGLRDHVNGNYEILICYDFDADTTLPAIAALNPQVPKVRLVKNNLGKGVVNAIRAGFQGSKSVLGVVVTMADLSDPPERINALVERLRQGDDVVAGSRYMKGGEQIGGPWLKGFLSRLAGTLAYYFTGIGIHDVTTNFRAYSRRLVETVPIESKGGFELGLELTTKCHLKGWRVGEVPSSWHDRTAGESRFQLFKWLPGYLNWYLKLLMGDPFGLSMKIRRLKNQFPRPGSFNYFGIYEKPNYGWIVHRNKLAAMIVAVTPDNQIVFVRQNRPIHSSDGSDWEIPGGAVENGEDILTAAARELQEESGYISSEPGTVYQEHLEPVPGMGCYPHTLVVFRNCKPNGNRTPAEDPGIREVKTMTQEEIRTRIQNGELRAMPTLAGLFLYQLASKS